MFQLPDLSKLERSINDNTAVQRQLYEMIVKLNASLDNAVKELKEINRPRANTGPR
jgi:phospholipase/lecithinase/hemolysin